jgi:small-conductance mechanosensitive channel
MEKIQITNAFPWSGVLFVLTSVACLIVLFPGRSHLFLTSAAVLVGYWFLSYVFQVFANRWILNQRRSLYLTLTCIVIGLQVFFATFVLSFVLKLWGIDVTNLIASLGLFAAALGIAFQTPLGNLAAGLILDVLHEFHEGDKIKVQRFANVYGPGTIVKFNPQFITMKVDADGSFVRIPHLLLLNEVSATFSTE